jgi:hypothetical protein
MQNFGDKFAKKQKGNQKSGGMYGAKKKVNE